MAERSVGKGEELGDTDQYLRAAAKNVEEMFAGKKNICGRFTRRF
jgi:hypothetical protein